MSSWYEKVEVEAVEEIKLILAKPLSEYEAPSTDEFDPWEIFPFYGSYSSDFDDLAITTLTDVLNRTYIARDKNELAQEMFREILCKKNLCDYGTSPRTCWANQGFEKLLPELIEKWKQYYKRVWGEEWS